MKTSQPAYFSSFFLPESGTCYAENRPQAKWGLNPMLGFTFRRLTAINRPDINMRTLFGCFIILSFFVLASCTSRPRHPLRTRTIIVPGQQADGTMQLPNQWFLHPVGKQIVLGDFPVNIAVHPGGK